MTPSASGAPTAPERRHSIASPVGPVSAVISTWGATLVSLVGPDRDGRPADVCLGFESAAGYRANAGVYFGCTVGRVANRIAGARFTLDGTEYRLAANDRGNHLHGGTERSFDRVAWEVVTADERSVTLRHASPDGEEGYPGRVEATVRYAFEADGELAIELVATTDRRTPVNLTNHAYWDLAGEGTTDVLGHELTMDADRRTPTRPDGIPIGTVEPIAGTPYDLRRPTRLREAVAALAATPPAGFDDNLVLRSGRDVRTPAAVLRDPASGRTLALRTDAPCIQVYSANMLAGVAGKGGHVYGPHGGICLEPQSAPDAVNQPALDALGPSVILEPGATYRRVIGLRLTAD